MVNGTHDAPHARVQNQNGPTFLRLSLPGEHFFLVMGFTYPELWNVADATGPPETMRLQLQTLHRLRALTLDPEMTGHYQSTAGFEPCCR